MFLTYKYRLTPTKKQQHQLNALFDQMQAVYNDAINERRWAWRRSRRSVSYFDQSARMTQERRSMPDQMGMLNVTSIQQMLRRMDKAYKAFYKGKHGAPRFKGRDRFKSVEYRHGNGCKLDGKRLYVQHVGQIRVKLHRPIPDNAEIKRATVKRSAGKWHVCLQLEMPDPVPAIHTGPALGVDVGLHSLLALSNGKTVDNPRWLKASTAKLRVANRRLSRRKKFGAGFRKAKAQVAKLQDRIANQRRDFWHKTTTDLATTYSLIAIEDLNLAFMLRSKTLSRSAHDAALGMFRQMLEYKVEETGAQVVAVNPHNTSQICSGCGVIVAKSLKVRTHRCPDCGLILDRDVNAAVNILNRAVGQTARALTYPVRDCVALEAPPL